MTTSKLIFNFIMPLAFSGLLFSSCNTRNKSTEEQSAVESDSGLTNDTDSVGSGAAGGNNGGISDSVPPAKGTKSTTGDPGTGITTSENGLSTDVLTKEAEPDTSVQKDKNNQNKK